MADRLTRRERAAMVLALCMLRSDVATSGGFTPWASDMADVLTALRFGGVDVPAWDGTTKVRWRVLLALYLRARLRADAGDCGRWRRVPSGKLCQSLIHNRTANGLCLSAACGCYTLDRRIAPLWQSATETRR